MSDDKKDVLLRALAYFRRPEPASNDELREVLLEVLRSVELTDDRLDSLFEGSRFDDDEKAEIRRRLRERVLH